MKIILLSGLPGSGKTTWIKCQKDDYPDVVHTVFSADSWHTLPDGQYVFNPSEAMNAHSNCLRGYIECLRGYAKWLKARFESGMPELEAETVYVDNTNLSIAELAPYMAVAQAYLKEYPQVLTVNVDPEVAWGRNVHEVPREVFDKMLNRRRHLENDWPPWWPQPVSLFPPMAI